MQAPSASDPSFKAFLDKLQEQNNRGFVTQLVQLKAEREIAGEDNDKREEQLSDVISSLKEVREAVTGTKIDIDLTPLVNIGENQTKLLEELSKEAALTRKLTEGSVEYDKEAAQYRNTSGRDIESKVSGKTSKDGGFLDFETARDTLSGQGKRAKEANAFDLKPINYTPGKAVAAAVSGKGSPSGGKEKKEDKEEKLDTSFFGRVKDSVKFKLSEGLSEKTGTGLFQTPSKEVEKKDREANVSSPRQANPEADNVASTGEIMADTAKNDLELSKQMLDTTKAQLVELKAIREALAPKTPKDLAEQKSTPIANTEESDRAGGGGSILGDLASGAMDLMGGGKKAAGKVASKAAGIGGKILGGAKVLGNKAVGFANSGAGKLLGSVAAVGLGAYTAYEGFTAAEDSKQAKMEEVQAKVDSGKMKPEEAAAARKEIGNTATVEKSGAIGEGTGMAAGAIAGAKLGAMAGTFIGGPVGTAIGGLAGGALGAFAGSSGGKYIGEKVGSGINAVKGFFGGSTDIPGAATKEALAAPLPTVKEKEASAAVAREEKVTGGPGAKNPVASATPSTSTDKGAPGTEARINYIKGVRQQAGEEALKAITAAIEGGKDAKLQGELAYLGSAAIEKYGTNVGGDLSPQTIQSIGQKAAMQARTNSEKKKSVPVVEKKDGESAAPGTAALPVVEKMPVDTATPGAVTAVAMGAATPAVEKKPIETTLGKAVAGALGAEPVVTKEASLGERLKSEANRLGIDPNKAKGSFEGGVLTKVVDQDTGKEHNIEVSEKDKRNLAAVREMRAMNDNSERLAAAASRNLGSDVNRTSTENVDMSRETGKGGSNNTVVSNNVSSNSTTKIVPMKANPRPEYTGSSLDRYTNRITVY